METFDYIVVGAGSAGCAVAYRLSEGGARSVLVLEAGTNDWSPYLRVPAGTAKIDRKYDWRYTSEPDASRHGLVDAWAAGKVVGGGSSVNAMMWVRGHPGDFDEWANLGATGWDWNSVLPYFKRAETWAGGADEYRGGSGPQHVSPIRVRHELSDAFVTAAVQAGHVLNPDYNGRTHEGVSLMQASQRRGWRHSTARAYLARARRRRNVTVRTGALVRRVLIEDGRAIGVEYDRQGSTHRVGCRREAVLSAGALASPKLLMLSGVGPEDHLRALGLPVLVDRPGVGQNLQEHAYGKLLYQVNRRTLNQEMNLQGVLKHGLDFVLRGRGAAASPLGHAVLFGASPDSDGRSDYQIIFSPFALSNSGTKDPADSAGTDDVGGVPSEPSRHDVHDLKLLKTSTVAAFPSILHSQGRGSIALRSARPEDPPVIRYELVGDDRDMTTLIYAARVVRDVFSQPAMKRFVVAEEAPGPGVQTDDEWRAFFRKVAFGPNHAVGTCRMGTDELSVVDPELRVHGVDGLRVIDASVMPSVTSGNTNAPTIMIGERGADLMLR